MICPYCGGVDACEFTDNDTARRNDMSALSVEDWRALLTFMTTVYLPFVHQLLAAALERKKAG